MHDGSVGFGQNRALRDYSERERSVPEPAESPPDAVRLNLAHEREMTFAIALAVLSALLGAVFLLGLARPRRFIARARRLMGGPARTGATAVRLLLALLLWFSAPVSATPVAFRSMAVVVFAAALIRLMLGRAAMSRTLDRMARWPPIATRLPCAAGLALCAFMLWSVSSIFGGS